MKLLITITLPLLVLLGCTSTSTTPTLQAYFTTTDTTKPLTGGVRMVTISTPLGKYNVYTKRFGHNPTQKVLLLHGGPGGTHEYFESFESYLPQAGIEFIYYDQLGSYNSDKPTDSSLWVTSRFVDEVEQVRQALKLDSTNFYLLGHSWGGILAMEYALKYQQHLKGLIISNMMSSCPKYAAYNKEVLQPSMNPQVVDSILQYERTGNTTNPNYMNLLLNHYYNKHVCRIYPFPQPLNSMFAHTNGQVYTIMQGPSEFGISGRLATWDCTSKLHTITKPTLVIRGMYDTMDPAFMQYMSKQLPNGTLATCPTGSHCSMWDDQEHYFPALLSFIK